MGDKEKSVTTMPATATAKPKSLAVGDDVLYVPDMCHASIPDVSTGKFPWVFGAKKIIRDGRETTEEVVELSQEQLAKRLAASKRGQSQLKELIPLRPALTWPGIVTAVNEDGTVNADVKCNAAVTLHCNGLKIDESGKIPHTVCAKK